MIVRNVFGLFTGLALCVAVTLAPDVQAFTNRNLIVGSQGYDVDELQSRLAYLGYYHGKIDGNFSWKTYWAVRDFQWRFGMETTGEVTLPVKQKLVAATPGWKYTGDQSPAVQVGGTSPATNGSAANGSATNAPAANGSTANAPSTNAPGAIGPTVAVAAVTPAAPPATTTRVNGISPADQSLMAHVVYGEARGEPFVGQVAIAAVILNRLSDPRFPHSIPGIVYQPGAFTCMWDGQANLTPNASAIKAVQDAVSGWDPSQGAVYYFNPATATSPWIWSRPQITKIGHHIFER